MSINLEPDVRVALRHLRAIVERRDDKLARHITIFRQFVIAHENNDPLAMDRVGVLIREELVDE